MNIIKNNNPTYKDISIIKKELRKRRMSFIGSNLSVYNLVHTHDGLNHEKANELVDLLTQQTKSFLKTPDEKTLKTYNLFYKISIYCLISGKIRGGCIDDILQLAECLALSREVFFIAAKDMLPKEMTDELCELVDIYEPDVFSPSFEDNVLSSVCVFLGVLEPNNTPDTSPESEEKQ